MRLKQINIKIHLSEWNLIPVYSDFLDWKDLDWLCFKFQVKLVPKPIELEAGAEALYIPIDSTFVEPEDCDDQECLSKQLKDSARELEDKIDSISSHMDSMFVRLDKAIKDEEFKRGSGLLASNKKDSEES